jgi:hypothetical protein
MVSLGSGVNVPLRSAERTKEEERQFRDSVTDAAASGATTGDLRKNYGLVWASKASPVSWNRQAKHLRAATTQPVAGKSFTATCGQDEISGGARPEDMTMHKPGFFVGLDLRNHYAIAKWTYNDGPTAPGFCSPPVAGRDGMGITLSQDVSRLGESIYRCSQLESNRDDCKGGALEDNNQHGATYSFQDHVVLSTLQDNYRGAISVGFRYLHPRRCHQAFAKYAHTRGSTSITGFDVGLWSLGIQWSSSSQHWAEAGTGARDKNCP